MATPNLADYDLILINSSAGKDSQAMLHHLARQARAQDATGRVVVVHADLGDVEWTGTAALAQEQAEAYGLRFEIVRRTQSTLLEQVEQRGMWPSAKARYCTSDQKRAPIRKLITALVAELALDRTAQVLNCLGMRAAESCARARKEAFQLDTGASSSRRQVWTWLPIHDWADERVWSTIRASGVRIHPVYAEGMTRASCSFCILASKPDLLRAVRLRPELAARYAALEARIGHRFRADVSMAELIVEAGKAR
ncbi:phosphoadenosine phosphosulfate reductase family protein [Micromonospora haikouensis]|uniref:phosphoadenosine phosphosulfate reductase domain-containing protein n=1 Tax=Micromonospora haikouensis TaxID=686309 RepID=UPI003D7642C8